MKVTIRNIGIIRDEVTIDLKPLTIFIGPNNSGKTWLAYILAGILGPFGQNLYAEAYVERRVPTIYEPLNKAIEQVLSEGNAILDLRRFGDVYGEEYFNNVANYARTWMSRYLSTQLVQFDDMDVKFDLAETKKQFLDQITKYSLRIAIVIGPQGSQLTIRKSRNDDTLYAFTSSETQDRDGSEQPIGNTIPPDEVRLRLINFVSTALRRSLYPQVCIFPTERAALVDSRIGASSDAILPVRSFLSMLNVIFDSGTDERNQREKIAINDRRVRKYVDLAAYLERHILSGSVDFSTPEPDPRREVLFRPATNVSLEIPIASSMVKELSPLVLYLRHFAEPGELLIIDEPEMNLHPEAQAKIIEFLAMLVNAGLNVLFTTHSPYITDHLTNLIRADQSEDKEKVSGEFFLKQPDAFISKDKVSVYGVHAGEVRNVLDEDGIINWSTFGDVSERISEIFFKL